MVAGRLGVVGRVEVRAPVQEADLEPTLGGPCVLGLQGRVGDDVAIRELGQSAEGVRRPVVHGRELIRIRVVSHSGERAAQLHV